MGEITKRKGWVPSPDKYKLEINWLTQSPKQNGQFLKKPRITFSGEVVAQTAKENRPSPSTYDTLKDDRWKKLSQQRKTKGMYTFKEEKITFVTEATNIANEVPASNKYDKVKLDTYLARTMYTKIPKSHFPRF